jgi:hypothetical protein
MNKRRNLRDIEICFIRGGIRFISGRYREGSRSCCNNVVVNCVFKRRGSVGKIRVVFNE